MDLIRAEAHALLAVGCLPLQIHQNLSLTEIETENVLTCDRLSTEFIGKVSFRDFQIKKYPVVSYGVGILNIRRKMILYVGAYGIRPSNLLDRITFGKSARLAPLQECYCETDSTNCHPKIM
jgi:hypothetical protein